MEASYKNKVSILVQIDVDFFFSNILKVIWFLLVEYLIIQLYFKYFLQKMLCLIP